MDACIDFFPLIVLLPKNPRSKREGIRIKGRAMRGGGGKGKREVCDAILARLTDNPTNSRIPFLTANLDKSRRIGGEEEGEDFHASSPL